MIWMIINNIILIITVMDGVLKLFTKNLDAIRKLLVLYDPKKKPYSWVSERWVAEN